MNAPDARPRPRADRVNRGYLDAWREGRLVLQRCLSCGILVFYPRPMCPGCWSTDLTWTESPGRGTVVSFTRIHRPNHPAFFDELPIVLAEIALAEGAVLLARLVCPEPEAVTSGMAVQLSPAAAAEGHPLPTFVPEP